jgi:hypothetical protein
LRLSWMFSSRRPCMNQLYLNCSSNSNRVATEGQHKQKGWLLYYLHHCTTRLGLLLV